MRDDYTPKPISERTQGVTLPAELDPLLEGLAEAVHDEWAVGKMKAGFKHGTVTDNAAKTHTDLVPYSSLPEATKDYDRNTAKATLLTILANGYRIVNP